MPLPTIKLKKSSVLGRKPDSADLAYGELAINYNDGKLYYKNSSNIVKTFLDSGNTVDLIDSAYIQARQLATPPGGFDSADFNSMFAAKSTTNLSEGTNKYYTKARADSDDKYPTAYAWTAGTTAGPTGSLTGTNLTAISFAAIPAAGAAASGIITTDTQTIAGTKTFSSTITGSVSGNAGTATTLATGRNFSLTGEVTAPAISFNGSGAVALATTIATDAVDSSNILTLSVSSAKIQTGAITTAKFATGAVDSAALGALSVSSAKLQASIPDSKLATISTASKVSNSATTATNLNTASTIVARDASGNFTAGTITAALTGNASTATTLSSGQNFSLTGEVTAPSISFNGSGAVALVTTIAANAVDSSNILALSVSSGKIQSGAITTAKFATGAVDSNALGALSVSSAKLQASIPDSKLATISTASKVSNSATTATNLNTASAIVARDASGNFTAGTITATLSGSATTLATGQNFSLTGEVTAPTISFNGSGAVALSTTIAANAVDSSNILALSVSSGKIQTGAITTAKFATGAVDSAALGSLSVSSAKLQASIPDSKLATIATALKVSNSATTATNVNTASAIVARDASGNFTAGTITTSATDTATTATHYFVETASDGAIRPKTLANVKTELVTTAAVNSAAATTVGTITSGTWNGSVISATYGGTGISSLGTGVATFLGTPSSANLLSAISDETGTGALVFAISPALTGTPTAPTASAATNTTQIATTAFVTTADNLKANLTTNTFTGAQIGAVTALTSTAASIAINLATNCNFSHATTENTTLAAPSNPVAGQSGNIVITQGAIARTLAYNTFYKFAGGTVPTLSSTTTAVTFTATGDTVGLTAHGLSNGDAVAFATIVTTTGISINTSYFVVGDSANTFQVSLTSGGSAINLVNNGTGTLYLKPVDVLVYYVESATRATCHLIKDIK